MILAIGLALLVVAVVLALAARRFQRPAHAAVPLDPRVPEQPEAEPVEPALREPGPEPEPVITWTAALTNTPLDEAGRLRLIDDLALLMAPWTIELLRCAYQEEVSPQVRARLEIALASCGLVINNP